MMNQAISVSDEEIKAKHTKFQFPFQVVKSGIQIDKFCIFQEIGRGAHAKVYRGKNKLTNQQIAVKVIDKRQIEKEKNLNIKRKARRYLTQESIIMMKVNSNNVLKCYECFESENYKFMIIEFCNQGSLYDKVDEQQKIPEYEAVSFLKQIVNGISACHQNKIIHRDIKLANFFIHNGVCKLADFGYSKILSIENEQQTLDNTTLGNFDSIAPQVLLKKPYGLKADIWSIGVIFYQMVFGQLPFIIKHVTEQDVRNYLQKRIQEINKSEVINGVKPSLQAKKLLKDIFVIDDSKRIGWRQLLQHDIFKIQSRQLQDKFVRQVQLKNKSQILLENQNKYKLQTVPNKQEEQLDLTKDSINKKLIADFQKPKNPEKRVSKIMGSNQQLQNLQGQNGKQEIKKVRSRFMLENQIEEQKKKINREQDIFYQWAHVIHVQCLRAQCIFEKIVKPIQKYEILDLTKAQSLRLMFLLCTRCLNFISPINFQYQKRKNSKVISELHQIVINLYKNIKERWGFYDRKLCLKDENSISRKDWYEKVIKQKEFNENDKFFAGIQDMREYRPEVWQKMRYMKRNKQQEEFQQAQGLSDYTKLDQISFTEKNIEANLVNLKQTEKTREVKTYLKSFKEICTMDAFNEKAEDFKYILQQMGSEKQIMIKKK